MHRRSTARGKTARARTWLICPLAVSPRVLCGGQCPDHLTRPVPAGSSYTAAPDDRTWREGPAIRPLLETMKTCSVMGSAAWLLDLRRRAPDLLRALRQFVERRLCS